MVRQREDNTGNEAYVKATGLVRLSMVFSWQRVDGDLSLATGSATACLGNSAPDQPATHSVSCATVAFTSVDLGNPRHGNPPVSTSATRVTITATKPVAGNPTQYLAWKTMATYHSGDNRQPTGSL
jgi:hypothetical protein